MQPRCGCPALQHPQPVGDVDEVMAASDDGCVQASKLAAPDLLPAIQVGLDRGDGLLWLPPQSLGQADPNSSMHAFADDIAIYATCPRVLTESLRFMAEDGEAYGLKLNLGKTEIHAWLGWT